MPNSEAESLKQWLIALAWIFFGVALVVGLTLWTIEVTSIEQIQHSSEPLAGKSLLELKNQGIKSTLDALKTVATAFGGVAILFNVFYAAKRVESMDRAAIAAEQNIEIGFKNAVLTEERLITERFAKAIELLGNKEMEIRIGGIYALERIARDSPKDYWQVIEVLAAYVREKAPCSSRPLTNHSKAKAPTDIQAILTVLGRRKHSYGNPEEPYRIDLAETDLRGVMLTANLQGVDFHKANLQGASFIRAKLQETHFMDADLQKAYFSDSELQQVCFLNADLREAVICDANLQKANLVNANLEEAHLDRSDLRGALLQFANLKEASLQQANLEGAKLKSARLQRANLEGTRLRGALELEVTRGLTLNQLRLADIDEEFRSSKYFSQLPEDEIPF